MAKSNCKVVFIKNYKDNMMFKVANIARGYARILFKKNIIIPVVRHSNIIKKIEQKIQLEKSKILDIKEIIIYREEIVYMIKKPITVSMINKYLLKKHNVNISYFHFNMTNIFNYGTYSMKVFYSKSLIHTIQIIVLANKTEETSEI